MEEIKVVILKQNFNQKKKKKVKGPGKKHRCRPKIVRIC